MIAATAAAVFTPPLVAGETVYPVTGVIRSALQADGRIVVAHEDIPDFMPAMTMKFTVANPAAAAGLAIGDRVRFQLHVNETSSTASDFIVVAREPAAASRQAPSTRRARVREGDRVPDFSLTSETNQPLTASALRDHLTVITFIFSRCPIPEYCPAMAARFGQLQRAILADAKLATRARLLSITLDPDFDRPAVLRAYGAAVGANPSVWQFATGRPEEITALTQSFAVFNERNGATLDHTLCTALIGADGRVLALWRGNGWHIDDVLSALADANAPLAEATLPAHAQSQD